MAPARGKQLLVTPGPAPGTTQQELRSFYGADAYYRLESRSYKQMIDDYQGRSLLLLPHSLRGLLRLTLSPTVLSVPIIVVRLVISLVACVHILYQAETLAPSTIKPLMTIGHWRRSPAHGDGDCLIVSNITHYSHVECQLVLEAS